MNKFQRIFLIVLDSVGVGEAKDADMFGDVGANTVGNISKHHGLDVPNLEKMGLGLLLMKMELILILITLMIVLEIEHQK